MSKDLERLFGLLNDPKRIYQVQEGEVEQEEFQICQVLDQLVFGDKGYVETLGPTWFMIHDPRFTAIEATFILHRNSVLGGDATLGKQYIAGGGQFSSSNYDLESYAEVLGEGRYFHTLLTHPQKNCPVRKWLERTWSPTTIKPSPELVCTCPIDQKTDPHELKNWSDDRLWALIKQECPNYFRQNGAKNREADRLHKLFKADLVGVIEDYAITPQADEWIELETGDTADGYAAPSCDAPERILLEVDVLEKALTYRASLRVTAVKILRSLGVEKHLKNTYLTDQERDELLRIVYTSDWPNDKPELLNRILAYIENKVSMAAVAQREQQQLESFQKRSKETLAGLINGTIQPINRKTDGEVQLGMDDYAATVSAILEDPFKKELYPFWQKAVETNNEPAMDLLRFVFGTLEDARIVKIEEEQFERLQAEAKKLLDPALERAFADEFHSKDSYHRGWQKPIPLDTPMAKDKEN